MGLFGFKDVGDMFDGGGAGGSGDQFYGGSHDDYLEAGGTTNNPDGGFLDKMAATGKNEAGINYSPPDWGERNDGGDGGSSGLPSLASTNLGGLTKQKQYEENLRRYEEYMKSQGPKKPEVTPEMRRAALDVFESQRGAGQMPYYMAAAQGATSPAFQYAAQNYATLGGSQRLAPRPMEMMSVAERGQINDMAQSMADQQAEEQRRAEEERRQAQQERLMSALRFGGKGGSKTAPQQGGGFNSMEELMEFQRQNPTMNLMGEYQRLKALEAGSQQAAANDYQAGMDMVLRGGMGKGGPRTAPQMPQGQSNMPPNFGSMLMSRFGRFGS